MRSFVFYIHFTFIFLIVPTSISFATTAVSTPHALNTGLPTSTLIMIDPGHGGNDGGATYENAIESKIVFKLAEKLVHELKKNNINAILTRTSDMQLNLAARVKKAEESRAQWFSATIRGFGTFPHILARPRPCDSCTPCCA